MSTHLVHDIADHGARERVVQRFGELGIRLPTIAELSAPETIPEDVVHALADVGPDDADPHNLFRVHWFNDASRRARADVPEHLVLTRELTGVDAKIVVALGDRFPMIGAHKVLAAYGCLVPRLVSGRFDPERHRAVWPSTGNYCRGGIAISRILGCRGVAVLPEGMSAERFRWLEHWTADPTDIIRTPGTESNVKEIYDACHVLERDPANVVLNQFSEFGNYAVHRAVTGPALERVFEAVRGDGPLRAAAYVSASGSGGTLAAGDHLKARLGARIGVVEALECPTLLYNGFGEHNIQGIGDKHLPLIHNVANTDFVVGISDRATDGLNVLFNTPAGQDFLTARKGIEARLVAALPSLGLSAIANVLAAIKLSRYLGLGTNDAVLTVATDGAELYRSELSKALARDHASTFDEVDAAQTFGQHLLATATDHVVELDTRSRARVFNLGYYTWVEQQGVSVDDFEARRDPAWWDQLMTELPGLDAQIVALNVEAGAVARPA